jgi:uncharacterized protein (TIGR00106 family)
MTVAEASGWCLATIDPIGNEEDSVMVLAEVSLFPLDQGESVGAYVARSLEIIDRSGLDYRCHAMGTDIEGEFDQVMDVVRQCFDVMAKDCNRIECTIKLDYRKGRQGQLQGKVASVEARLGHAVRK